MSDFFARGKGKRGPRRVFIEPEPDDEIAGFGEDGLSYGRPVDYDTASLYNEPRLSIDDSAEPKRGMIYSALEKIKDFSRSALGYVPNMDLSVSLKPLSEYYTKLVWWPSGRYIKWLPVSAAKIVGQFNPETNEITLDPSADESTVFHELFHGWQNAAGIIDDSVRKFGDNARKYIELMAEDVTESLYQTGNRFYRKAYSCA